MSDPKDDPSTKDTNLERLAEVYKRDPSSLGGEPKPEEEKKIYPAATDDPAAPAKPEEKKAEESKPKHK